MLKRVIQFRDEGDVTDRTHGLVRDKELGDEVAARLIDGVCNRGERPALAMEHALPACALLHRSAVRARRQPSGISLKRDLTRVVDGRTTNNLLPAKL